MVNRMQKQYTRKYDNKNRKEQEAKKRKLTIRLDEETYNNLEKGCAYSGLTKTEFITQLVNKGKVIVLNEAAELAGQLPIFEERLRQVEEAITAESEACKVVADIRNEFERKKNNLYLKLSGI